MLSIEKPHVVWAWVCPITGIVWDEGWGSTPAYAKSKTERSWGKTRTKSGEMRLVRVTIEPLTDAEASAYKSEYASWLESKGRAA